MKGSIKCESHGNQEWKISLELSEIEFYNVVFLF